MNEELIAHKNRLKAEIEIAEEQLENNIDNFRFSHYLIPDSANIAGWVKHALDGPSDAIIKMDAFSRVLFGPRNLIRKFFRSWVILIRGYDIIKN